MASEISERATEYFPYSDYRDYQKEALIEASEALHTQGFDNVILNLPTGIGKSAINVTLAEMADSAFITTPQKALRTQLEEDRDLNQYYTTLRARDDYSCPVGSRIDPSTDHTCKTCPVNNREEDSCMDESDCTYWVKKRRAIGDKTAVLTFSYLIVDGFLPIAVDRIVGEGSSKQRIQERVSFEDRDLLIVDECHKLEGQVASLHAGVSVSRYTLPKSVIGTTPAKIGIPEENVITFADIEDKLQNVYDRAENYIQQSAGVSPADDPDLQDCISFCRKYEWCREQTENGRDWVIDKNEIIVGGGD